MANANCNDFFSVSQQHKKHAHMAECTQHERIAIIQSRTNLL